MLVVYESRDADLAAQLLNSLYERIGDDLRALGIDRSPSISYRDRTEDSAWSDLMQPAHSGNSHDQLAGPASE